MALFADTFTTWFEPENARAAVRVLEAAGYRVRPAAPPAGERRPLCCGRTFLAAGLVAEARRELARTLGTLAPFIERGVPIVGLEPSCLFTFRDEALKAVQPIHVTPVMIGVSPPVRIPALLRASAQRRQSGLPCATREPYPDRTTFVPRPGPSASPHRNSVQ